jgi:hypothetical protein
MKIFHKHATMYLLEKIHTIRYFHSSWRCIHLQLSGKQEKYNRSMRAHFIIRGFAELLEADDGYVYLCDDGDIIILFQGRATPILTKLSTYFADIDPRYGEGRFDRFFTTYDLSKDWAAFSNMCFVKSLDNNIWEHPIKNLPVSYYPLEESQAP